MLAKNNWKQLSTKKKKTRELGSSTRLRKNKGKSIEIWHCSQFELHLKKCKLNFQILEIPLLDIQESKDLLKIQNVWFSGGEFPKICRKPKHK